MANGTPTRTPRWPLVLIALALAALAVIPILQEHRISEIEEEVVGVLEPANDLGQELSLLVARQMSRLQTYLLTGDQEQRIRHEQTIDREREIRAGLRSLATRAGVDLGVAEPLVRLSSASSDWHVGHEAAFESEEARVAYQREWAAEQRRYDEVFSAARELQEAVSERARSGRERMADARAIQTWLTVGLALLALIATLALAVVERHLRALVDESDRRRAESLRARREMQAVLEASADGVMAVDLEGRCTTLNSTGSSLLAYPEVDAQGRSLHELLHGKAPEEEAHPPEACPALRALRSGADERQRDDVVWRRDGTCFPCRWHLRPMRDGREIRGGVITITDMTEIREAERALEDALRAREEVVAVVSHDLRNPLGTVMGAAELIEDLDLPRDKVRRQARAIRAAGERMHRLIQDLLDVARIEAGGLSVDPGRVRLDAVVAETLEIFEPQAVEHGVELRASVEPPLPDVLADPDRLGQVFSNLVGNALKFTPEGGTVEIRARAEGRVEPVVHVEIRDTGRGIEPEHLAHLFDRFWKAERAERGGAGLGLAIVQGIVEAHGGEVWVESEVGQGTTVHLTLPLADAEEPSERDTADEVLLG